MMGVYANPREPRRKNSCMNSASISYSITPGLTNRSTRSKPAFVMSQARCIWSTSWGRFTARMLWRMGALRSISWWGYLARNAAFSRSERVSTVSLARVCWLSFKYNDWASAINRCNVRSNAVVHCTLAIPVSWVAWALVNLAPSQMANSSLVSNVNKISRSAGLCASGNSKSTVSSWSTPLK